MHVLVLYCTALANCPVCTHDLALAAQLCTQSALLIRKSFGSCFVTLRVSSLTACTHLKRQVASTMREALAKSRVTPVAYSDGRSRQ